MLICDALVQYKVTIVLPITLCCSSGLIVGVLGGVVFAVAIIAAIALVVVQRYVHCAVVCKLLFPEYSYTVRADS